MKKGILLLIAILTLSFVTVKADVAAPIINNKNKVIKVEVRDEIDIETVRDSIQNVNGVKATTILEKEECEKCEVCETCSTSQSLSENDVKNLKTTTYIIYATLGILVILMIIIIALLVSKRKKDSKKDA